MNNTSSPLPTPDKAHVLLVGRPPPAAPEVEEFLTRQGFTVWQADTLEQADAILSNHEVAVAVLPLHASSTGHAEPDGTDIARHLRNTRPCQPLALLFLAASEADVQRILSNPIDGIVDVMPAPWDLRLLQHKLEMFIHLNGERAHCHAQRDEFLRARKLNAMMVAVLTHDLRTPMTAVELSAEIVHKRAENESVRKAVTRIRSSIARMVGTIHHLISVSNVGSDLVPTRPEAGDLNDIATEAIAEFLAAKPDARVALQSMGDTRALIDVQRIAQVFSNLIGLAVEHGGIASPVSVKVDGAHRAYVRISVSTDATFPESVSASLFSSASPPGAYVGGPPGVGLGLSIVEQLVRAHGGTVVGTSDTNHGTVFDVMLPRAETMPSADGCAPGELQ